MADNYQPVDGAAKDVSGNWVVQVGGRWVPAEKTAKNDEGKWMAVLKEGAPKSSSMARSFGAAVRGAGPYTATAAAGAAGASAMLGPEAAPVGAAAGIGAGALTDLTHFLTSRFGHYVGMQPTPGLTETAQKLLDKLGVPRAETVNEKTLELGSGFMAGGPTAVEANAAKIAAPSMTRTTARQSRISDLRAAGVEPTVGTTGGRLGLGLENALGRSPGATEVMQETAAGRVKGMSDKLSDISEDLSPGVTNERAGAAVKSGIDRWYEKFRLVQDNLASAVAARIPPTTAVNPTELLSILRDKTKVVPGAEELTSGMADPYLKETLARIERDLAPVAPTVTKSKSGAVVNFTPGRPGRTTIPWEAMDKARRDVGEAMKPDEKMPPTSRANLSALYRAIMDDMEGAVPKQIKDASGAMVDNPARKAWERLRDFTKAGHERYENVLAPIAKAKTGEQAYRLATSGTAKGSEVLRGVMKGLTEPQRDVVRSNVIMNMGRDNEVFSIAKFADTWEKKLHPEAKAILFPDPKVRASLEKIAGVAHDLKEAGRTFSDPSAKNNLIHTSLYITLAGTIMSGSMTMVAKELATAGGIMGAVKLMTHPPFVDWLAKGKELPAARASAWVAQLGVMAARETDADRKAYYNSLYALAQEKLRESGDATDVTGSVSPRSTGIAAPASMGVHH